LRTYRKLEARHGLRDPLVLTTFPFAVDFVRSAPAHRTVYYCVDDFLDYPGVAHADWAVMEAELLDCVDGLVVTSRELARKRRRPCPLLPLPHGVDFEHFPQATAQPPPEGPPRPVVGFFGLLSEWFDVGLVEYLADSFPHVSFVLIGQARFDPTPLTRRPNVRHLGWVPYADLPRLARSFDVGLIPYVVNRWTR